MPASKDYVYLWLCFFSPVEGKFIIGQGTTETAEVKSRGPETVCECGHINLYITYYMNPVKNTDAQGHERLGEIDDLLPL